jgi:phosphoglycerate kinase
LIASPTTVVTSINHFTGTECEPTLQYWYRTCTDIAALDQIKPLNSSRTTVVKLIQNTEYMSSTTTSTNDLIPPVPSGTPRRRNVLDVLKELQQRNQRNILVRVDYNVPIDKQTKRITDDSRIRGSIPTIQAILNANCNAILCSHMGRPKLVQMGNFDDDATRQEQHDLSLQPVATHLSTLIQEDVLFASDCMNADDVVSQLPTSGKGGICLLENLRFYKQEEKNNITDFATKLASYANGYVNDAFGSCHRAHASTAGVPSLVDPLVCGIGALVASELTYLDFKRVGSIDSDTAITAPSKIAAIIGGSKVSTKLPVIKGLLDSIDVLLLCGGLAFTFLRAMDVPIGSSLVEDSMVETAKEFIEQAKVKGKQLLVPIDAVCAASFPTGPMDMDDTITVDTTIDSTGIPEGYMGLDAGPKSVSLFLDALQDVTKVIMNGPLGVFEIPPFDAGTRALIDGIEVLTKENNLISVVGGGDSVAALEAFGKMNAVSYVSTGGGATLELLAGDLLPGVEAIAMIEQE